MASRPTWRDRLRPIVADALAAARGLEGKAWRKSIREAYPYERRAGWPYRVWLSELKIQRGLRVFRRRYHRPAVGQSQLFGKA